MIELRTLAPVRRRGRGTALRPRRAAAAHDPAAADAGDPAAGARRSARALFERTQRTVALSAGRRGAAAARAPPAGRGRGAAARGAGAPPPAQAGQLRLAFVSSIAYGPLPEWLRGFRAAHPDVALRAARGHRRRAAGGLRRRRDRRRLRAACARRARRRALPPGPCCWSRWCWRCREQHPAAARRRLAFERMLGRAAGDLPARHRAVAVRRGAWASTAPRAPRRASRRRRSRCRPSSTWSRPAWAWPGCRQSVMQLQRPGRGLPAAGRRHAAVRDQPGLARAGAAGGAALRRPCASAGAGRRREQRQSPASIGAGAR